MVYYISYSKKDRLLLVRWLNSAWCSWMSWLYNHIWTHTHTHTEFHAHTHTHPQSCTHNTITYIIVHVHLLVTGLWWLTACMEYGHFPGRVISLPGNGVTKINTVQGNAAERWSSCTIVINCSCPDQMFIGYTLWSPVLSDITALISVVAFLSAGWCFTSMA